MTRTNKTKRHIWTIDNGRKRRRRDEIATEEPLEIQLAAGGEERTIAITMRTPGNDYELAAGFLYNEGVIADKDAITHMIYCVDGQQQLQEYNVLRVNLLAPHLPDLHQLDRHFFTSSACGVCGRTMLDDLAERTLPPLADGPQVTPKLLAALPEKLLGAQRLFESTGGLHAAALFDKTGNLLALREDVGRHNALDKLIGWGVLNNELPFHNRILMVSGRASYELLQKCRVAGVSIFCAVSAPSSLAVDLAEHFGITLIGFLRGERFNVYTGIERILLSEHVVNA
ncbi:MAG: formate dehydrogenase accessory sulfurtransferase FdhD [Caldilineaceae bacterium]